MLYEAVSPSPAYVKKKKNEFSAGQRQSLCFLSWSSALLLVSVAVGEGQKPDQERDGRGCHSAE